MDGKTNYIHTREIRVCPFGKWRWSITRAPWLVSGWGRTKATGRDGKGRLHAPSCLGRFKDCHRLLYTLGVGEMAAHSDQVGDSYGFIAINRSGTPSKYLHLFKFRAPQRENSHHNAHREMLSPLSYPWWDVALFTEFSGLAPSVIAIVLAPHPLRGTQRRWKLADDKSRDRHKRYFSDVSPGMGDPERQPIVFSQELIDMIIDQLVGDCESLKCCSLVSRRWRPRCRYQLFKTVTFTDSRPGQTIERWCGAFGALNDGE